MNIIAIKFVLKKKICFKKDPMSENIVFINKKITVRKD